MGKLAVIGAGMMGEALVRGLLGRGWNPADVVLCDVRAERVRQLCRDLGVLEGTSNAAAAASCDATLLAVKPNDVAGVLEDVREAVSSATAGLISIAAGVTTAALQEGLGAGVSVIRAMPNTPARVGKGVTALAPGPAASEAGRELAAQVFSSVGPVVWVAESSLDAVTALSASGPAYVYLVAEAMVEAGVLLGLSREVAETLAYATIEGAGAMLVQSGDHPASLRAQVTSPGGTTAAGLAVLEAMAVRAAFGEAMRAAQRRSRELGG